MDDISIATIVFSVFAAFMVARALTTGETWSLSSIDHWRGRSRVTRSAQPRSFWLMVGYWSVFMIAGPLMLELFWIGVVK